MKTKQNKVDPMLMLVLVFVVVMMILFGGGTAAGANDPRVFRAVYDFPKVANVRVNLSTSGMPAMLLFEVEDQCFIWQFKDGEGDEVSALFALGDRLEKASRIEVERWLPQPGTQDRSGYQVGMKTYYALSELVIYK